METIKNIKLPDGNTYKIGGGLDDKITNCITEIPQDIKLEINDGTLTLKAGSKVYVPNGFEADGTTPKFDEVVIESDLTLNYGSGSSYQFVVFYGRRSGDNSQSIWYRLVQECFSGATAPTTRQYMAWYDTNANLLKLTENNGATWLGIEESFPICIITASQKVDSIDQTFNGFGYIGSTVFVLPNVKGLIPNGRNEDGTLNNIEVTTTQVRTHIISAGDKTISVIIYNNGAVNNGHSLVNSDTPPSQTYKLYYKEEENEIWNTNNNAPKRIYAVVCATATMTYNNGITSFTPKLPFRAVDYNDLTSIVPTGTVISSASSATPTGYLYCNGAAVSRTTYADLFSAIGTTYGTGDGSTTFNLPNYSGYKFVTNNTVSVKGTGIALGLTDGSLYGGISNNSSDLIYTSTANYGKAVGASQEKGAMGDQKVMGLTTDASKSGITGTVSTATIKWYIKY